MTDGDLIQIVDAQMAEAARRSGQWLLCGPGCMQCCLGPFEITPLDAARLRDGLSQLASSQALRIVERAQDYMARAGGRSIQELIEGDSFDEEPCPALDPTIGICELYSSRPITCRTFGPPARAADGSYSVCELCFDGATEEEIAACWVDPDPNGVEAHLLQQADGPLTIVATALIGR